MVGHRQDQQALPLLAEQKLGPSQICKVIIILQQQGMRENVEECRVQLKIQHRRRPAVERADTRTWTMS